MATIDKEKYWMIVFEFLCNVHNIDFNESIKRVRSLAEISDDSVFEHEPFFVACALAESDADVKLYNKLIMHVHERYAF